jgi:hypothetical protein
MAIDAKFTADFSQFETAVKAASGTLKKLEGDAASATTSVAKLSDDAAGRFTVTTKQMQDAGIATQNWSKDFQRFDSVLSAVGINIGTAGKALGELGAAAGQTATSMGLLGTAGLAAGAAIAGWQIGRWIADILDLDEKIANLNGSIDALRAQEKGAGLDVLANASKLAGREITNMAEALRIVNKAQEDHNLVLNASKNAAGEAGRAYAAMYAEIRGVRERGDLPELQRQLQSYDFSLETLSTRFGVHRETLEQYRKTLKAAADQEKEQARILKEETAAALETAKIKTEAFADAWKDVAGQDLSWLSKAAAGLDGMVDRFDAMMLAELKARDELAAVSDVTDEYEASVQTAGEATTQAASAASSAVSSYQALGAAVTYAAGSFQNMYTQIGYGESTESKLRKLNDMASAYGQAGIPVVGGLFPGRAAGGPVSAGAPYMVGENGPELFVPRTSGAILPNGGTGGVQVNIYGSVLSTQRELAMLVEDAITRTYRQHGNRLPV